MNRYTRRDFLKLLGTSSFLMANAGCMLTLTDSSHSLDGELGTVEPHRRPNILFIMADDLGWADTGCYGSTFYETPNIDALAKRGMRFTSAYTANPLCSPTRASIMTGLYPARLGITSPACHLTRVVLEKSLEQKAPSSRKVLFANTVTRLKQEYFTLAEALHEAGYVTGHFGKWHLGTEPYDPLHQGFDVDKPHWHGPGPAGSYIAPWKFPPKLEFTGKPGEHIEDRMADEAIAWLKQNKNEPFFLNYWAFSIHAPFDKKKDVKQAKYAKYKAKAKHDSPQRNPVTGGMIESLDENVGRLITAINDLGLSNSTIVIFFSDNGSIHWTMDKFKHDSPISSSAPLRGGKATIYEGGTRVPLIVVWPGVVKAEVQSDALVSSVDFYPTILEMLHLEPKQTQQFDGMSFIPALKGQKAARDTIFCHFPHGPGVRPGFEPSSYVRKGDWKLIRFYCDNDDQTDRFELYNLSEDIGETNNLTNKYPEKVHKLNALMDKFLNDTKAVIPKPNPVYKAKREG